MIKAVLAATLLMSAPAHAGALDTLIEWYAREEVCPGIYYDPIDVRELTQRLEDAGMTFNEIRDKVVREGHARAGRIEVSGDKDWICR